MGKDPIRHLLDEHQVIMAEIALLRTAVNRLDENGEAAISEVLPVFIKIGQMMATRLDAHRRKEDEILFPALEAILGTEGTPTAVMRQEHKEIHAQGELLRQTLHELEEIQHPEIEASGARLRSLTAEGEDMEAMRATAVTIIDLLDMHFMKEEQILFPMAHQILEPATMEQIASEFERQFPDPGGGLVE